MKKKNSNHPRLLRLRYALFCLGKTFRTRKNEMHSRDTSNVIKDKNTFTAIDDEGKEAVCNILFTFDNAAFPLDWVVPALHPISVSTKVRESKSPIAFFMFLPPFVLIM